MARVARRLDLGELKPAEKRDDGTIRAQAYLTRCGIFKYMQPDGTVRRELRLPEDVFDPVSLNSLSGVPVTNDHPPEMVTRDNAKKYAVGALQGMPKRHDDHMLGDLAIYDGDTIDEMKGRGKVQVSLGYTCDLDETPGHHPVYGDYDARQLNIRGNHCAIVDVARAGQTARVRLDAAQIVPEDMQLALCKNCAKVHNMADNATRTDEETPEQGGTPKSGTPDPQDLASRSAEGATDSKPGKKKRKAADPSVGAENQKTDSGDDDEDDDDRPDKSDDDDPEDDEDDDDLDDDDDDDDDNKASAKSKKRKDDSMTDEEKKALIKDRDSAIVRADAAEKALAKAEGELLSAKKDLEAAKATTEKMRTDAADKFDAAVDAKVALLTEAKATGAEVTAKMSPIEIKRAVVKHVDSIEVPAEKPEPYVDALYEGALRRARTDAAETKAGAEALAAARKVAAGDQAPTLKNDAADLLDEVSAARKARARSAEAYMQPWAPKKESK